MQKVREAAARAKCSNNLKQQMLAVHNFAGVTGHFPAAFTNAARTNQAHYFPGWGWGAAILPYLEQDALYTQMEVARVPLGPQTNSPPRPSELMRTPLTLFRCPSNDAPELNPYRMEPGDGSYALSNYRAVCGTGGAGGAFRANEDRGGAMFQNSKVTFLGIIDGTSNTVALGECAFDDRSGVNKYAAIWPGTVGLYNNFVRISDVMWHLDEDTAKINGPAVQAFGSRHTGGAFFGFCDGGVRYLREGGDPAQVMWLGSRNDGHVGGADD